MAFGGGAADALFGAGSGNVLTKITKWATVHFLRDGLDPRPCAGQCATHSNTPAFEKQVQQKQSQMPRCRAAPARPSASRQRQPAIHLPCAAIPADSAACNAAAANQRRHFETRPGQTADGGRRNAERGALRMDDGLLFWSPACVCWLPAASAANRPPTSPSSTTPSRNRLTRRSSTGTAGIPH